MKASGIVFPRPYGHRANCAIPDAKNVRANLQVPFRAEYGARRSLSAHVGEPEQELDRPVTTISHQRPEPVGRSQWNYAISERDEKFD